MGKLSPKPLKYTEKIAVSFTTEQVKELKEIAEETGESVAGLLRRLALEYMTEKK